MSNPGDKFYHARAKNLYKQTFSDFIDHLSITQCNFYIKHDLATPNNSCLRAKGKVAITVRAKFDNINKSDIDHLP